jgi:thioredoxin-related protein
MKNISIVLLVLLFSLQLKSQEANVIKWQTMPKALEQNTNSKKLIFVDVYTDWCGWCKRMDQTTFADENIIKILNKDFIAVKFNAEGSEVINYKSQNYTNPYPGRTRSTHTFTNVLLGHRFGFPSFALLHENNNVIGVLQG